VGGHREDEDGNSGLERRRLVRGEDHALNATDARHCLRRSAGATGETGDGVADGLAIIVSGGLEVVGAARVVAILDSLQLQGVAEARLHGVCALETVLAGRWMHEGLRFFDLRLVGKKVKC
jgi:hypothetical protein